MRRFGYEVVHPSGQHERATIEAEDQKQALRLLHMRGVSIIKLYELKPQNKLVERLSGASFGSNNSRIAYFCTALSRQLKVGIALLKALGNIQATAKGSYQEVLAEVSVTLASGCSFAESLEQHPKVFPKLLCNIVRVGEYSGALTELLEDTAVYYRELHELQGFIKQVALYPLILCVMAGGLLGGFVFFVVPSFASLYTMLNIPLHSTMIFLLWLKARVYFLGSLLLMSGAVIIGYVIKRRRQEENYVVDILLCLPIVGTIIKNLQEVRFCKILGMQLSVGVDLLTALKLTHGCLAGSRIQKMTILVVADLVKGRGLYEALVSHNVFMSKDTLEFVAIGEKSGDYAEMLGLAQEQSKFNLQTRFNTLKIYLQPVIFIGVTLLLATVIMILLQPMLGVLENVGTNW